MTPPPDFIIIGAMKAATTTLHDQLAAQPGIFMSAPKEPCFFSDDEVFAQGEAWYRALFDAAGHDDLRGESSTHYTKLPTYPHTIERLSAAAPHARLIYIMRHPIDRLISQYIHEWTQGLTDVPIDRAIDELPILIDYSRYAYQLEPYRRAFGRDAILPVFFDCLHEHPQAELERVCRFIGYDRTPSWSHERARQNASEQRIRRDPLRERLLDLPGVRTVRRRLIPQTWRDRVKRRWMMTERPTLSPDNERRLAAVFDEDLAILGRWLGVELNCENFKAVTRDRPLDWAGDASTEARSTTPAGPTGATSPR